jgi:hypothetical protein
LQVIQARLKKKKHSNIIVKGFPWWPGMVDYCPDVEDSFLVSEVNPKEAAEYHVV